MSKQSVPGLERKVALLVRYGAATGQAALAGQLGVSYKTLRWWILGDAVRPPDQIPLAQLPALVALLRTILPDRSDAECRHLLLAPFALLEEAVGARDTPELMRILRRDGARQRGRIIRFAADTGLVEIIGEPEDHEDALRLGEAFRIEFKARHDLPHAIGLQQAGHAWRLFRPVRSDDGGCLLVPGLTRHGEPAYMAERTTIGRHSFACLESAEPFPAVILSYERENSALDKRGLELIAGFYERLDSRARRCQLNELDILEARDRDEPGP